MEFFTLITMLLIPGIVWGGFIYFLILAIRKEKLKNTYGE